MLLYKEIKFIHVVELRSGCKKRDDCKIQPYHQVFIKKKIIINHLRNRPSQTIRQTVFFKYMYLCTMEKFYTGTAICEFPPIKYMYISSTKLHVYCITITIYAIN